VDSRWMPLFAAAVGVLGGVGGAYIGGVVANEGQERQSQSERAAAVQDVRRDVYGDFLATVRELAVAGPAGKSQEEKNEIGVRLFIAKARVDLVTDKAAVEDAAAEVLDDATKPTPTDNSPTSKFLAAARDEIKTTGK
jgi:hypothetical protein